MSHVTIEDNLCNRQNLLCYSFESPEKPQLAEMAGSPKKVVSDPLIPEAKIETEPKDTQVPEPLLQTALKEEKEVSES